MNISAHGWGLLILCAVAVLQPLVVLYVATTKLDKLESRLTRSKIITDTKNNWVGSGMVGRLARLAVVFSCLLIPQFWIDRALLDSEEIHSVPRSSALWVLIPGISCILMMPLLYFYP